MIPDKLREVLNCEGVVSIASQGRHGLHLVNTWNSYVKWNKRDKMLIPVGGMKKLKRMWRQTPIFL